MSIITGKKCVILDDVKKVVDDVMEYVGKDITMGVTLALGKPFLFVNELYRRAKDDPEMKLSIITALSLEHPKGNSDIERRLLNPIAERLFDGVPELDFAVDQRAGKLPPNVQIYEFYGKAGAYLNDQHFQMNHLPSNFTHAFRDGSSNGFNVLAQILSVKKIGGKNVYSLSSNPDICIEALETAKAVRAKGGKVAIVAEANENMPYMYGDAIIDKDEYNIILQGEEFNTKLFGAPKDAVALTDHMLGINVSPLVKDGGTIQVGIGALGDAIVSGLVLRNEDNQIYNQILEKGGIFARYGDLIKNWGGTGVFKHGLYGSSEMFVDAFMQMYKRGILKRKVFDSIPIMQLINKGELSAAKIPMDIIDKLIRMKAIQPKLTAEDFKFLTEFGILKKGLRYDKGTIKDGSASYPADMDKKENRIKIKNILGKELQGGQVMLGAFFIGPQSFYKTLNDMSEEERSLFGMCGVEKVNQLYGDEVLRELQRKDSRFVNTGMKATLLGAIASDQLEDARVVSGIGGQLNFAYMSHIMRDARFIMVVKSTKGAGRTLRSNIVFSYGHCSVPRYYRDIVVTEYGIADVKGKPDRYIIQEMLNIADSRFQPQLLEQAKKSKKIPKDYEIPEIYRHNTPDKIAKLLKPYQDQGYFQLFPFGTDLTQEEIKLGGSLKGMKSLMGSYPLKFVRGVLFELLRPIPKSASKYLARMDLTKPSSIKERITRKLIVFALRNNKAL
jgi:acyl-CoA hydrolase